MENPDAFLCKKSAKGPCSSGGPLDVKLTLEHNSILFAIWLFPKMVVPNNHGFSY